MKELDPLQALVDEHTEQLVQAQFLESSAHSIRINGFSVEAFEQMLGAINYFDTEMLEHNRREEKYLCPLLARHVEGPTDSLLHDHRELRIAIADLRSSVREVEDGHLYAASIRQLVRASQTVVDEIRNHIEKENNVIFPLVRRCLTSKEYKQLKHDLAAEHQLHQ